MLKKMVVSAILLAPIMTIGADINLVDDPIFEGFRRLQAKMDAIFEDFHKEMMGDLEGKFSTSMRTKMEDKGDFYNIKVDMPKVKDSAVDVKIENGILSIRANVERSKEDKKDDKTVKREVVIKNFYRAMSLPSDADGEKMTTEFRDGLLTIKIPKK